MSDASSAIDYWGGYRVDAAQGGSGWKAAVADYREPQLGSTSCSNPAVAFWSGIGGYNSSDLGQTGTASGIPGWPLHTAWFEVLPENMIAFHNHDGSFATADPTQDITAYTQYEGSNTYELSVTIAGQIYSVSDTGAYDGSTAEELAERPKVDGTHTPLLNFNWVDITGYNGVDQYPLGGSNTHRMDMGNYATVGPLSNGEFKVTQNDCDGS